MSHDGSDTAPGAGTGTGTSSLKSHRAPLPGRTLRARGEDGSGRRERGCEPSQAHTTAARSLLRPGRTHSESERTPAPWLTTANQRRAELAPWATFTPNPHGDRAVLPSVLGRVTRYHIRGEEDFYNLLFCFFFGLPTSCPCSARSRNRAHLPNQS